MAEPSDSFPAIYVELKSLRLLMDERDQRYTERAAAAALALKDALAAQEKLAATVNESARLAINKAEDAQRAYNERSNEFRGQLDDQAKTLMPRAEYVAEHTRLIERVEDLKRDLDAYKTAQAAEIRSLRESRASYGGIWQAVVAAAVLAGLIGAVVGVIGHGLVR